MRVPVKSAKTLRRLGRVASWSSLRSPPLSAKPVPRWTALRHREWRRLQADYPCKCPWLALESFDAGTTPSANLVCVPQRSLHQNRHRPKELSQNSLQPSAQEIEPVAWMELYWSIARTAPSKLQHTGPACLLPGCIPGDADNAVQHEPLSTRGAVSSYAAAPVELGSPARNAEPEHCNPWRQPQAVCPAAVVLKMAEPQ